MKKTSFSIFIISFFTIFNIFSNTGPFFPPSICSATDDRIPSFDKKIARAIVPGSRSGCTLTMIGRTCAISAGHCYRHFEIAEFDVPLSNNKGVLTHSAQENVYLIDKTSIVLQNQGVGNDFAVFRLHPHLDTQKYAGDERGWYPVAFRIPSVDDIVSITGFGYDSDNKDFSYTQQTHSAEVVEIDGQALRYRVDTTGGNSGSSVIDYNTGEILGIHTHGGCWQDAGANQSTLIAGHPDLERAIRSCLDWEAKNL